MQNHKKLGIIKDFEGDYVSKALAMVFERQPEKYKPEKKKLRRVFKNRDIQHFTHENSLISAYYVPKKHLDYIENIGYSNEEGMKALSKYPSIFD